MESYNSRSHVRPRVGCRCTEDCRYYDCPCLRYLVGDGRPLDDIPLGGCHHNPVGVPYDFSCWSCYLPDGSCRCYRRENYRNYEYSSNDSLCLCCHYDENPRNYNYPFGGYRCDAGPIIPVRVVVLLTMVVIATPVILTWVVVIVTTVAVAPIVVLMSVIVVELGVVTVTSIIVVVLTIVILTVIVVITTIIALTLIVVAAIIVILTSVVIATSVG